MKKIILYITGVLTIACVSQSCKKTMIDLNTNPGSLPDANPEYMFTGATQAINFGSRDQLINRYQFMQFMQYMVPNTSTGSSLEGSYWVPGQTKGPAVPVTYYSDYYTSTGWNMHKIIASIDALADPTKSTYAGLKAICQIVDVYHAWRVVDVYGAMPYAQAFNSDKYPYPAYQGDFDLYKTFDSTLKVAATSLKTNTTGQLALGNQDFFYNGDYDSWLAFANTLRIKIAQRYQKRDGANFDAVLKDVGDNFGGKLISSNAQSFGYSYSPSWNTNVDDMNVLLVSDVASYAFVQFLKSTKDPRLSLVIRQNDFGSNYTTFNDVKTKGTAAEIKQLDSVTSAANASRYWGRHAFPDADATYGWTAIATGHSYTISGQSNPVSLNFISNVQTRYYLKNGGFGGTNPNASQNFMHDDETYVDGQTIPMRTLYLSYAETCFMMAEIAYDKGTVFGKSATQWYNAGVGASITQYQTVGKQINVPGADSSATTLTASINTFLAQPSVAYNGTLDRIYAQEWVHLFTQPEDAWAMWKRTGYPQFAPFIPGQPSKIGDGSGTAYLETLSAGSSTLTIPRRTTFSVTSSGSALNSDNVSAALSYMEAKIRILELTAWTPEVASGGIKNSRNYNP